MKHHIFQESNEYKVAVLCKSGSFNKKEIEQTYIHYLSGVSAIAFTLEYSGKSVSTKDATEYLKKLLPVLESLGTKYLYVTDGKYFKTLTKVQKLEPAFGYVMPCTIKGYEHLWVVLGVGYGQLIYDPKLKDKVLLGLWAIKAHEQGNYQPIGLDIIHSEEYPETYAEVSTTLAKLHQYEALTCDIETFSLRFNEAGIGSIAFAWNQHEGIAFMVDSMDKRPKQSIRYLVRKFLETYKGKLIFHNASFDIKVLIYQLWMRHSQDYCGLLTGLEVMTRNIDDTKIIAYLATNSTAGNTLKLKELAHSFAGNYSVDNINDITKIEPEALLKYNLIDALSTWYVHDTYWSILAQDEQESVYNTVMLPSIKTLLETELVGMPMQDDRIQATKETLSQSVISNLAIIMNSDAVKQTEFKVRQTAMIKANAKLKTKQHPIEKFNDLVFNPNSGQQLQELLYETLGLPVLATTDTGQPSTDGDTLEKLLNHTTEHKEVIQALIDYNTANKILTTFIPAFEAGILKSGTRYLHGGFNLGGTVSGRMSSNNPNLQNLPSNSEYGKAIKKCFKAPDGWIMVGADFSSLEDYISALLTKDKNKLAVYLDGYDGHCLRAAYYFKDSLPDIEIAPDNIKCYKANVGNTNIYFHAEETVEYLGKSMKGKELYALLTNQGV